MNKMLVAVFENEKAAFEGLSALKDLHEDGDITLYDSAVITKDKDGKLQPKSAIEPASVGAATGVLAGSIIGLIGGPVGVAIGAASGFFGGLLFDLSSIATNVQFAEEVATALTNGKTAIVAEIDESWTVPIDTRLGTPLIFRRLRNEVLEDQLERESNAIAVENEKLREELHSAAANTKAKIESAMEKLQARARIVDDQLRRKMTEAKIEADTKVNAIQEQMQNKSEKRKSKMEKRIADLQAEYVTRSKKLKRAAKLVSEAFEPSHELHI